MASQFERTLLDVESHANHLRLSILDLIWQLRQQATRATIAEDEAKRQRMKRKPATTKRKAQRKTR